MDTLKAPDFSQDDKQLFSILRDLRRGHDAIETLVAITTALCTASEGAIAIGKQLKLFPNKHLIGFNKYSQMQDAFLVVGQELGLPIIKVPHPGTSTYYAALEHDRLRLTLGHVQKYTNNPKLRPFRLNSRLAKYRPWQLSLIDKLNVAPDKQLVGTIVYGYAPPNLGTPYFMEVRYIDGNRYMSIPLDLLELRRMALAPHTEQIRVHQPPKMRKHRQQKDA